MAEQQPAEKKFRASSAVTLKTLSAWEQANLSPWYHPQFWLDLLIHPSKDFTLNHQRRRARLYALVSFIFLIASIIANCIFASDGRSESFVGTMAVVNIMLFISYILSRTHKAQLGKSLGVFAVWLLPYVNSILRLQENATSDVTVADSVNWLFTPSWMLMSTIFLSRSMTVTMVLLDCISLLLLPALSGATFFDVKNLLFFHMVCGVLLLLASIIAFRDKLQLYSQADGQSHEDQHQAGAISRFLLQPHHEITDRIFRRRSRILSAFLLGLIPCTIAWVLVEASMWKNGQSDGVVIGLSVVLVVASALLYVLSRTQYTRWASRLTLFMLLITPYIYYLAPTTTQDGQLFANLLTMTGSAILGITLFSGAELVALAAIIFFPTVYSPVFPPHVILSLILLVSSFIYRRDIKEIHDTAVNRDELYDDNTSDLLIPWESRYFFGLLSYIQMVFAHYALGGFMLAVLGLAALVAATSSVKPTTPLVTSTIVSDPATANYYLYVHTLDCSSGQGQIYTITGTQAMFQAVNQLPLAANTLNSIFVQTSQEIGSVLNINMKTGTGGYALTQREFCTIDRIEVWDPLTQSAYSTALTSTTSAAAQSQAATASRRLLQDGFWFGDCSSSDPVLVNGFFGQVVAEFDANPTCKFFSNAIAQCKSLQGNKGFSPMCWETAVCGLLSQLENLLLPCYLLGCSSTPQISTCSGNGACVLLRLPQANGTYSASTPVTPVCDCDEDRYGPLCTQSYSNVCPSSESHNEDGTCGDSNDPFAGATVSGGNSSSSATFGEFLQRFDWPTYSDQVSAPFTLEPPLGKMPPPALSSPVQWTSTSQTRNMLALGFIELLIRDVASVQYAGDIPQPILGTGSAASSLKRGSCYKTANQYANNQTFWIDLSLIYGPDPTLQWFQNNVPGALGSQTGTPPGTFGYFNLNPQSFPTETALLAQLPLLANAYNGTVPEEVIAAAYFITFVHDTFSSNGYSLVQTREYTINYVQYLLRQYLLPAFFTEYDLPVSLSIGNTLLQSPYQSYALNPQSKNPIYEEFAGVAPLAAVLDVLASLRNPALPGPGTPLNFLLAAAFQTPAYIFNSWAGSNAYPTWNDNRNLSSLLGLPNLNVTRCALLNPPSFRANGCPDTWSRVVTGDPYTELYPGLHLEPVNSNLGLTPALNSIFPRTALGLTFGLLRKAYLEDQHNLNQVELANAGIDSILQNNEANNLPSYLQTGIAEPSTWNAPSWTNGLGVGFPYFAVQPPY